MRLPCTNPSIFLFCSRCRVLWPSSVLGFSVLLSHPHPLISVARTVLSQASWISYPCISPSSILLHRRSSSSSSTLPTAADHYYTLAVGTRRAVSPNAGQSSSRPSAASQSVLLSRRVVAAVPSMSMSMSFLSLAPILPSCVSCWYTRRLVYCHSPHPILQFPAYHLFTRTVLCFCVPVCGKFRVCSELRFTSVCLPFLSPFPFPLPSLRVMNFLDTILCPSAV
ncbi:hypothetical protein K466DRAFT_249848 [Polyporus arcularius HHB13444]|uniref:Uncharacterized protein n=1 Tax=Polyporus arcularius HHB13444 TaxID=1314778 RepID=A0A5C3P450_9APHY|nr:hypothetical protein K466DRAFT_249848 [Polyporus arcularius HHB13444]